MAADLGYANVDLMLDEMGDEGFDEWMAVYQIRHKAALHNELSEDVSNDLADLRHKVVT